MTTWMEHPTTIGMSSTSAGDPWIKGALTAVMMTSTVMPWGTASSKVQVLAPGTYLQQFAQTSAGGELSPERAVNREPLLPRHALMELRRLSGLTWEQLASCFGVERRSLHFWASGKPMNTRHLALLDRLLTFMRRFDHGNAATNRALLLRRQASGKSPLEMMALGSENTLLETCLPPSPNRPQRAFAPANDLARMPQSPVELIGALHEPLHTETGASRLAKPRRQSEKT